MSRCLLAFCLAVATAATARPDDSAADDPAAITALKKMHAGVERDEAGRVTEVRLHSDGGTLEDAVPHLGKLPRLARLSLSSANVSAAAVPALAKLPALREIELYANAADDRTPSCPRIPWEKLPAIRTVRLTGAGVGDEQLEDVAKAPGMQHLHVNQAAVTAKGLAHLRKVKGLTMLLVQTSKVTADGAKEISAIDSLTELTLCKNAIGPDGFRHLAAMTGLEYLNLESTGATDADVAALGRLTNLRHLDLGYNPYVTDSALPPLTDMKKLAGLRLYETKVTDAGVATLKKTFPKLTVGK